MAGWALGFQDEVWWSRFKQPNLSSWTAAERLHLVTARPRKGDPEPAALACYGLWLPGSPTLEAHMLLRFVHGQPVSALTIPFLEWVCARLAALGQRVLVLIWDNAPWHISQMVRNWLRQHNRQVKQSGAGVRLLACFLPTKSPWLNPLEPKWLHAKRRIVEPERTLSPQELAERVCAAFDCALEPHLTLPENVH